MAERSTAWYPSAAYLYALHLDGPALAWEYLRRNPQYQLDWRRHRDVGSLEHFDAAQRWGLRMFEDPARDARDAHPAWSPDPDRLLLIHPDADARADAALFGFWDLPGRKHLTHDGRRLVLTCHLACRVLRMALSPVLEDGMAYVYAVRAGNSLRKRWRDIEVELAILDGAAAPTAVAANRPGRMALLHMQTLQALDGSLCGASQRKIAEVLFDAESAARRWTEDSELRAYIRRLIRRGRTLMEGDYRRLLQPRSGRQGH